MLCMDRRKIDVTAGKAPDCAVQFFDLGGRERLNPVVPLNQCRTVPRGGAGDAFGHLGKGKGSHVLKA